MQHNQYMAVSLMKVAYGFVLVTDSPLVKQQVADHDSWMTVYRDKIFTVFATRDLQEDLAECGIPRQVRTFVKSLYPDSDF